MIKGRLVMGIILLGVGVFVAQQAFLLSIGRPSRPGPGFIPFGLGIILIILAVVYLSEIYRKKNYDQVPVSWLPKRVLAVVSLLCFITASLNWLGYLICTFFLFLFWISFIERKNLLLSLAISFLALIFIYYFNLIFSIQLPKGLLKLF